MPGQRDEAQRDGAKLDYAGLIGFDGAARMSSAIGGVDVCITAPIIDPEAELNLPRAGEYTLEGLRGARVHPHPLRRRRRW